MQTPRAPARPTRRFWTAVGLTLAVVALPAGCEADPEREVVVAAFQATTDALANENWQQLWDLSDPESRSSVLELHAELAESLALVDRVYPTESRDEARRALGQELVADLTVGAADAGPTLLSRLLIGRAVDRGEGATDGRNAASVTIDGDHAYIHTSAGEHYAFLRTPGGWRSQLLRDLLKDDSRIAMLKESAASVVLAEEARKSAWVSSHDPRTPQGAYNLARAAASGSPVDAAALFALMDAPARAALSEAMETARAAQKLVQRKTTRRQRKAAYDAAGLSPYVDVDSDRALYLAWAGTPGFVKPVTATAAPRTIEGDVASGHVVVVTEAGEKVQMVVDSDGLWHLAGAAESIEASLVQPAAKALEALSAP